MIDRFVLTTDASFTPTGVGPAETPVPEGRYPHAGVEAPVTIDRFGELSRGTIGANLP